MKIYFAGNLFSLAEREFNRQLAKYLRNYGYEIFLPQEKQEGTTMAIFISDKNGIEWSDTILAIMDGADADSGTCWEFGYAYALNKRLLIIRTDFRVLEKWKDFYRPINLMIYESVIHKKGKIIEYYGQDIKELARLIDTSLKGDQNAE